ncbi:MAG: MFS transporter [Anaerolineae bacterium]|jgi:MFS family permease|nr:MFS transporter [Anaerolineae bacterium]
MATIAPSALPPAAPASHLTPEYKKTRPGAMFSFAVGTMSDSMEGGLINTLFPVIQAALGLPLGALGTLSSISKWARMLFGTMWAILGDKFGRKKVLVLMTGFWGLWTAAAGLAQNFTQLLILYSIGVIGTVAAEPIQNGLMVDMFDEDERGKAYGTLRTIGVAASLILTPLIGQLANIENGWRYGMFVMGGISVLSGVLLMVFLKEPPRRVIAGDPDAGKFKMSDIKEIAKIPSFWLMAVMLLFVTSMVFFAFMVTYFVKVRGWQTSTAAILYTVFMAGFALGGLTGGALGDIFQKKFGDKGRVMFMQVYLVLWAGMTFLFTQIDWGFGPLVWVVAFLTGLIGSWGFSGSVLPMVGQIVEPQYAGTTFALLFSFIQGAITAVYLLLIGPLVTALGSLDRVFLFMVVLPYAINAVFWTLFYFTYPKDVQRRRARMAARLSGN